MAIRKLQPMGNGSVGVTLPKDDVRLEGLLDEEGDLEGEHHAHIRHVEDGEWRLELLSEMDV